jgi:hypothetical protein
MPKKKFQSNSNKRQPQFERQSRFSKGVTDVEHLRKLALLLSAVSYSFVDIMPDYFNHT